MPRHLNLLTPSFASRFAARRTALLLVLTGALLSAPGTVAAQEIREWTPAQQEVIAALSRGPVGMEKDFEGWAAGYHPEWTYWRMGAEAVRPRDVHMELVQGVLQPGVAITDFELTPVDVVVMDDVAMVRANAVETIRQADGEILVVPYSTVGLMVRHEGRWVLRASSLFYPERN